MLKKEITFIYMDKAEWNMYQPIAEEAEKRGYQIKFTTDKFSKCEIGFYCQHVNYPQFSKMSVIMLHDIIQAYSKWPDLWYEEPWNKYDIGILPSKQWEDNWNLCSQWFYSRPRVGMFKVGWPKADVVIKLKDNLVKESFFKKYKLDSTKRTIVYAPAWENDHKQDDFVQSMLQLDVNILIKQAAWAPQYQNIIDNIEEMYLLHKDNPRVTILPPETNIFEAIAVSDILVSEESSTMCEAVMMGIPAISVSNWLIPDVSPSRFPKCDYDFVIMTTKENLTSCVKEILDNYNDYRYKFKHISDTTFSNIGNTSKMIMDIVDDYLNGCAFRIIPLSPHKNERLSISKRIKRKIILLRKDIYNYYRIRYKSVNVIWSIGKWIKNAVS